MIVHPPHTALSLPEAMRWLEDSQRAFQHPLRSEQKAAEYAQHRKFEIRALATQMLEEVWGVVETYIAAHPESLGLSTVHESGLEPLSAAYIAEDIARVFKRSREFPISRLRAWSSRVVEHFSAVVLADPSKQVLSSMRPGVRESYERYRELLAKTRDYWFRRTPHEHVGTGFHTALSAYFRMLLAAPATLWRYSVDGSSELRGAAQSILGSRSALDEFAGKFLELAQYTATAHMVMLPVLDGIVWDSAGSTVPVEFGVQIVEGRLEPTLEPKTLATIAARIGSASWETPREPRTGCPAMHGRTPGGLGVMQAVRSWCSESVRRWYWPLVASRP